MQQKEGLRLDEEVIKKEYRRLDERWLKAQYQANLWMVLSAVFIELVIFFILNRQNALLISTVRYMLKYVAAPLLANLALLLFSQFVLNSERFRDITKIYVVTLCISGCCLVLYSVHIIFPALYLIFAVPMIMTVVYADRKLTTVISAACMAEKAVADLLIRWDPTKMEVMASGESVLNFALSILILLVIYVTCFTQVEIEREKNDVSIQLERERRRLREQVVTDVLTGIGNRQALRAALREMENSRRRYMLAMIDMDGFKNLNDNYGHACGDTYLAAFGRVLRQSCSENVSVYRFGGDEFCMLFSGVIPQQAEEICRQMQGRFQEEQMKELGNQEITLSIGLADYRFGEPPSCLLDRADHALYSAKQEKNCIRFSAQE